MQKLVTHFSIVAAGLTLIGCASPMPPVKELERAGRSIGAAQQAGAKEHPQAAYHLNLAREALDGGERLIREEKMEGARVLLRRARADAELARAMAHFSETRTEATRIGAQVRVLEQQMRSAAR